MEVVPVTAGGGGIGYAESVDSSPRYRNGESWDEPIPSFAVVAASRLRLICNYGGRIVPHSMDRSLCYLSGEAWIIIVERHSLADLSVKLSRSLLDGRSFFLKYQLSNEDLDSLIFVTIDEDLDNMIDTTCSFGSTSSTPFLSHLPRSLRSASTRRIAYSISGSAASRITSPT